jgi:coproporphyrinogen III oxidase-like Fe-S oxidoreductase
MSSADTNITTEVGSYFISNYPPFSQWSSDKVPDVFEALDRPADQTRDTTLGLYIHIPFCRKRCKFCYFRVYTNQNAKAVEEYVQALIRELELLSQRSAVSGRELLFVYFGGGTPSYLSSRQLRSLRDRMSEHVTWDNAREVTFECEPGTLSLEKLQTLKDIGVTRVSLGVENFDDTILEANGRAHLSPEIMRAYDWIQQVGFPQVNIDLIAGMVGETDDNWKACVEKAIALEADNITIYQMELPFNTVYSKEMREQGTQSQVADWPTKRRWVSEAMDRLMENSYSISSGNELVRNADTDSFIYRDNVWRGCDLLGCGVSSFGHFQGVHYQNLDQIEDYMRVVTSGELPVNRALRPTSHQLMIREFVLLMKEGHVDLARINRRYGVDLQDEFAVPFRNQQLAGYVEYNDLELRLTRKGLLQVDSLLPEYFEQQHRSVRYT